MWVRVNPMYPTRQSSVLSLFPFLEARIAFCAVTLWLEDTAALYTGAAYAAIGAWRA